MDASAFDDDVAAFLQGGVSTKELIRRRSQKAQSSVHVCPLYSDVMHALIVVRRARSPRSASIPVCGFHLLRHLQLSTFLQLTSTASSGSIVLLVS